MKKFRYIILHFLLLIGLYGCFTGIESTPKISATDVKKEHIVVTAEQRFMDTIEIEPISKWRPGKRFRISDSKISLILTSDTRIDTAKLVGRDLIYSGVHPMPSVMGGMVAVVDFTFGDTGESVQYKTQVRADEIMGRDFFEIPFTVDLDIVDAVKAKIKGERYFITTPLWYDSEGNNTVHGLRHVEVVISDVVPGNSLYPIRVIFNQPGTDAKFSVYMTTGSRRMSTRNFNTLFAFEDPRKLYPNITDESWSLIVNSKVKTGMNRDECRLALGAPAMIGQRPTTAGMVEYWSYADGVYLIFEDGYLSSYRR